MEDYDEVWTCDECGRTEEEVDVDPDGVDGKCRECSPDGVRYPGALPRCHYCNGRLRWLGAPHHPDNPSSWVCDNCSSEKTI